VLYLLKAFQKGADGVYVAGCMEGDCHYLTGNLRARKRVEYAKKILDEIGIGGERLAMYNMSAAQGPRFVEVAKEMTARVMDLGPSPLKHGKGSVADTGTTMNKATEPEQSAEDTESTPSEEADSAKVETVA
jgi:hypothetical protein